MTLRSPWLGRHHQPERSGEPQRDRGCERQAKDEQVATLSGKESIGKAGGGDGAGGSVMNPPADLPTLKELPSTHKGSS